MVIVFKYQVLHPIETIKNCSADNSEEVYLLSVRHNNNAMRLRARQSIYPIIRILS